MMTDTNAIYNVFAAAYTPLSIRILNTDYSYAPVAASRRTLSLPAYARFTKHFVFYRAPFEYFLLVRIP